MRHWTQAERQQQAALIRQWQPWQHSTGAASQQNWYFTFYPQQCLSFFETHKRRARQNHR